jgi:hypothetical protein
MQRSGRLHFKPMNALPSRPALLLALLCLPFGLAADPDVPHYRVEVIVFSHADGRSDARVSESFEDFSELTDPLRRAQLAADPREDDPGRPGAADEHQAMPDEFDERERAAERDAALALIDTLAELEEGTLMPTLPTWPEPWLALEALSSKMERARVRLEDSPRHEVLAWRAWHQPLQRGRAGERVRIHDEYVIATEWDDEPEATEQWIDNEAAEPTLHYRLDGGIRLRQRQFIHLDSDLHWRSPGRPAASPWMQPMEQTEDSGENGDYEVHRLVQSRAIRAGRLEYFDSSWLGLLVLIERIQPLHGSEIESEDAAAAGN